MANRTEKHLIVSKPEHGYHFYRRTAFVPVTDDWIPNHPANTVEVSTMSLHQGLAPANAYRVCVWGADDFGMERDFETKEEAIALYEDMISRESLSRDVCRSLGLEPA